MVASGFFTFLVLYVDNIILEEHTASLFRIGGLELECNIVIQVGYKEGGHNQDWSGELISKVYIYVSNVFTVLSFCKKCNFLCCFLP
jgi:hypothetical protein